MVYKRKKAWGTWCVYFLFLLYSTAPGTEQKQNKVTKVFTMNLVVFMRFFLSIQRLAITKIVDQGNYATLSILQKFQREKTVPNKLGLCRRDDPLSDLYKTFYQLWKKIFQLRI